MVVEHLVQIPSKPPFSVYETGYVVNTSMTKLVFVSAAVFTQHRKKSHKLSRFTCFRLVVKHTSPIHEIRPYAWENQILLLKSFTDTKSWYVGLLTSWPATVGDVSGVFSCGHFVPSDIQLLETNKDSAMSCNDWSTNDRKLSPVASRITDVYNKFFRNVTSAPPNTDTTAHVSGNAESVDHHTVRVEGIIPQRMKFYWVCSSPEWHDNDVCD
jgi:hypothetical protein